jgi:hypothetical protein
MYNDTPDPNKGAVRLNRAARRAEKRKSLRPLSAPSDKDTENTSLNKDTVQPEVGLASNETQTSSAVPQFRLTEQEGRGMSPSIEEETIPVVSNSEKSDSQFQKPESGIQDLPEYWRIRNDVEIRQIERSAFFLAIGVFIGILVTLWVIGFQFHYFTS